MHEEREVEQGRGGRGEGHFGGLGDIPLSLQSTDKVVACLMLWLIKCTRTPVRLGAAGPDGGKAGRRREWGK